MVLTPKKLVFSPIPTSFFFVVLILLDKVVVVVITKELIIEGGDGHGGGADVVNVPLVANVLILFFGGGLQEVLHFRDYRVRTRLLLCHVYLRLKLTKKRLD